MFPVIPAALACDRELIRDLQSLEHTIRSSLHCHPCLSFHALPGARVAAKCADPNHAVAGGPGAAGAGVSDRSGSLFPRFALFLCSPPFHDDDDHTFDARIPFCFLWPINDPDLGASVDGFCLLVTPGQRG